MSATTEDATGRRSGVLQRILNWIERTGNRIPHPVTLFAILAALVVVLSAVLSQTGIEVESPLEDEGTLTVTNLLSAEGVRYLFTSMVDNFIDFAPLGVVLATMIGIGMAEQTGLISAALRAFIFAIPRFLMTFGIVFAGVMSSVASDAGYVASR